MTTVTAPTTTSAAAESCARRVSRTATARASGGAPSSTTSAKAPLRSNTSAHHAPLLACLGRITQKLSPAVLDTRAQSRGARVRDAST